MLRGTQIHIRSPLVAMMNRMKHLPAALLCLVECFQLYCMMLKNGLFAAWCCCVSQPCRLTEPCRLAELGCLAEPGRLAEPCCLAEPCRLAGPSRFGFQLGMALYRLKHRAGLGSCRRMFGATQFTRSSTRNGVVQTQASCGLDPLQANVRSDPASQGDKPAQP